MATLKRQETELTKDDLLLPVLPINRYNDST